ncbi:hypothetical protein C5167_041484 [Papaver somniferum]|nr:hypothetical protein C5167_041484 [Papaver somniferum]
MLQAKMLLLLLNRLIRNLVLQLLVSKEKHYLRNSMEEFLLKHLPAGKVALSPCSWSEYTSPEVGGVHPISVKTTAKLTSSTKTSSTTVSVTITITTTGPIHPQGTQSHQSLVATAVGGDAMRHHQQLRQPSLNSPELGYAQSQVSANSSVDPACFHQEV